MILALGLATTLVLSQVPVQSEPGDLTRGARKAQAAVDPISRAPITAVPFALSPPMLALLGTSLSVSEDGPSARAVLAPAAYFTHNAFLSTLRLEVNTGGDQGRYGLAASFGYNPRLLPDVTSAIPKVKEKCLAVPPLAERDTRYLMKLVEEGLPPPRENACLEPGDVNPQGALDSQAAALVAAQKRCAVEGTPEVESKAKEVGRFRVALESELKEIRKQVSACAENVYDEARKELAPKHPWGIHFKLGGELFPYVEGPRLKDEETGGFEAPVPSAWASVFGGLSAAYFWEKNAGLWFTGALTRSRSANGKALGTRLGGSVEFGYNLVTDEDEDGRLSFVSAGAFTSLSGCVSGACAEEVLVYEDPIQFSTHWKVGAFLDVRASQSIQVRLSIPLDSYWLSAPIKDSDERLHLLQLAPAITVTVADWSA